MIDFRSYEEQINILKTRGLTIPDEQLAIEILKQNNYYYLINGYKDIFIETGKTPESFIKNVSFTEIYTLHQFDKELRSNLSHILIIIERMFGSVLAHEFSRIHKNHDADYLNIDNFNQSTEDYLFTSTKLITKLNSIINESLDHSDTIICHYKNQYNRIPLWVLVNKLSFGTLAKMYKALLPNEKHAIAKSISEISNLRLYPNNIQQAINVLVLLRNKCAHDQKIFDFNSSPMTIMSNDFTKRYLTSQQNIHSLFGAIGCIALFVKPNIFDSFLNQLRKKLNMLFANIHSIPNQKILDKMGIPQSFLIFGDR